MAGFYGNIRNSTSNSFKFDRVFSNRKIMDAGIINGKDDGVFGGRYVLVEYDQGLSANNESPIIKKYYKLDDQYYEQELKVVKTITTIENFGDVASYSLAPREDDVPLDEVSGTAGIITLVIEKEILIEGPDSQTYETESYVSPEEETIDYYFNADQSLYFDKRYSFKKSKENVDIKENIAPIYNGTEAIENVEEEDNYTLNYLIDKDEYGNGRGYDSTVWRKVYKQDGTAQYVNVAELNSIVPTFAVSADEPSDSPVRPHFDADSTNVYYNLHLQSPWGFRIAPVEKKDKVASNWVDENPQWAGLSDTDGQTAYIKTSIDKNGNYSVSSPERYNGAIYFNKDGFNSDYHTKTDFTPSESEIRISNTGTSNEEIYNIHGDGHSADLKSANDIKELSIMLPALGDTVAEMWDLMYSDGSNNEGYRTKTIHWDDPNYPDPHSRLRLVTDKNDGYYYTPSGYDDAQKLPGEREIDTLAGAINSVHDLMGMIITKEEPDELEEGNLAEVEDDNDTYFVNALNKYIYYDTNADETNDFYYAGSSYGYLPLKNEENNYNFINNYSGYEKVTMNLTDYSTIPDETKQYIKINNYTLKRDNSDIASTGAEYFNGPSTLKYAGSLIENFPNRDYYLANDSLDVNGKTLKGFEKTKIHYVPTEDTSRQQGKRYYIKENETYKEFLDDLVSGETYYEEEILPYLIIEDSVGKICYKIDPTKEYFIPERKVEYYKYDDYTNKYVSLLDTDWRGLTDEQIETDWARRAGANISQSTIFRDGVTSLRKYDSTYQNGFHIYTRGNYSVERKKIRNNSSSDITYEYIALSDVNTDNATSLLELRNIVNNKINSQPAAPSDFHYEYTTDSIFKTIDKETKWIIDPTTGKRIETKEKEHIGVKLYDFQFDNGDLYEKVNGSFVKSSFKYSANNPDRWNSVGEDITENSNSVSFYKLYPTQFGRYEDGLYWTFESNDEELSKNPHKVYLSEGNLVSVEILPSETNGLIQTRLQDIRSLNLSVNGYSSDKDYWMMIKPNNDTYTKEDNLAYLESGQAAYGVNDLYVALHDNGTMADDKFYYADDALYIQREDGSYELSKKGYNYDGTEDLYTERKLFIIDVGSFDDRFNLYQEWNPKVIQSEDDWKEFFDPTAHADNPNWKPLVLGKKVNVLVRKELPGFARDLNTMHGLLLRINEILQAGNIKTRDPNTVQGCLNQLHDIFEKFDELTPGSLYGVNMFGQLAPVGFNADNDNGESWVTLQTHIIDDENDENYGKTILDVIHKTTDEYIREPLSENATRNTELNGYIDKYKQDINENEKIHDIFEISKNGDIISVTEPVVDNAGHVVGSKETNFTLPLNFSGVSVTGTSTAVTAVTGSTGNITPDNSADNLSILSGNKWVVMAPVDNTTDSLTIGHSLNGINAVKAVGDTAAQTPSFGATFKALDAKIDEAGHVTKLDEHTVKIPQGSLTQTANKNVVTELAFVPSTGAITSTRMDLAEIALGGAGGYSTSPEIGNTTTLGNAIKSITDYVNQGAENIFLNNFNDYYPDGESMGQNVDNNDNINEAIAKLQWQMDDHKENQLTVTGAGDTVTSISVNNGEISATLGYSDNQILTNYTQGTDKTPVANTDTASQALAKLQNQIDDHKQNQLTINGTGNTVTALSVNDGAITATLGYSDNQVLTNYILGTDSSAIDNTDTITEALAKLQNQINNHKQNQLTINGTGNSVIGLAVNDGAITATLGDSDNQVLTNYVLGTDSSAVDNTDTITEAIAKLQNQMNNHRQNQLEVTNGPSNSSDIISGLTFDTNTGKISATKTTINNGLLTGYTLGSDSSVIAATDTVGQAMSKLQNNITTLHNNLSQTNTNIVTNYCGIIRQGNASGTNVPHAGDGKTGHSSINTGWIWVDTDNHYVYINTGNLNTETGNLADAYGWELLNAWQ